MSERKPPVQKNISEFFKKLPLKDSSNLQKAPKRIPIREPPTQIQVKAKKVDIDLTLVENDEPAGQHPQPVNEIKNRVIQIKPTSKSLPRKLPLFNSSNKFSIVSESSAQSPVSTLYHQNLVDSLVAMGYDRSDAFFALEKFSNNLDMAANYLADKSPQAADMVFSFLQ